MTLLMRNSCSRINLPHYRSLVISKPLKVLVCSCLPSNYRRGRRSIVFGATYTGCILKGPFVRDTICEKPLFFTQIF